MTFCLPPEAHESLSLQKEMLQFRGHVAIRRSMPTVWTHLCFLHWTTLIKPKAGLWWPWPLISLLLLQGALWWPWPSAYPLLVLQGTPATFAGPVPLSVVTAVLLCPWPTLLTWWRWSGDMWQLQVWIFSALLELHSVLTAIKLPVLTSGFQDPSAESLPWTGNLTDNACSPASCSVYRFYNAQRKRLNLETSLFMARQFNGGWTVQECFVFLYVQPIPKGTNDRRNLGLP